MDSFKFFTEDYTRLVKGFPFVENQSAPWAPFAKPLNEAQVALVTTAGVHLKSQTPFDVESQKGDWSYREIARDVPAADLMVSHTHYDHADADRDINCVFPIDRLRELEDEKLIGSLAAVNYGFMGFIPNPTPLQRNTAQAVAQKIKEAAVDAVIFTAG